MFEPEGAEGRVVVPGRHGARLTGGLWRDRARLHVDRSLPAQWHHLEETDALAVFRSVAAGRADPYAPMFFSDSDLYKWADAAARALASEPAPSLRAWLDEVADLVATAQEPDGYVHTWVQTVAPGERWATLPVEHELYCLGHLIEAGATQAEVTGGEDGLVAVARRAADLLVAEFADGPPDRVDGHPEVEVALVRLARATGEDAYRRLAASLLDRRGQGDWSSAAGPAWRRHLRRQLRNRARLAARRVRRPGWRPSVWRDDRGLHWDGALLRSFWQQFRDGRYSQTDRPVRELREPTGHSVRWCYLHAAAAIVARDQGDDGLRAVGEQAWEALVTRHLFVSGGLGALPILEGFGAPWDLDPDIAYNETCAAIGAVQWGRELGLLVDDPRYDDLLEWQLLNAVAVGLGADGCSYTYDNALRVLPGSSRRPWFRVPCCPPNLSRTWLSVPQLSVSIRGDELVVHQFPACELIVAGWSVSIDSDLPWDGRVRVRVERSSADAPPAPLRRLRFRVPSWAAQGAILVDGRPVVDAALGTVGRPLTTASGLHPEGARWCTIDLEQGASDPVIDVELRFELAIDLLRQDPRLPKVGGWVAVRRGPLLYCLEGVDHPGHDHEQLLDAEFDPASLVATTDPAVLDGAVLLDGRATDGRRLRFVPYFLWGNRGATGMTTFVRTPA